MQQDTIEYHRSRVGFQFRDMSSVPLNLVCNAITEYRKTSTERRPESSALWFYLHNHACGVLMAKYPRSCPLGSFNGIMEDYHTFLCEEAVQMFYYLLVICARESRHIRSDTDFAGLATYHSQALVDFTKSLSGSGPLAAVSTFLKSSHPDTTIGEYANFLVSAFSKGKWSGGYGGKAWAEVAKALCSFVTGEHSAEMMVDTAFTLSHNNGPIFNKGIFYAGYDLYDIMTILDVQRSGQIPKFILDHTGCSITASMVAKAKELCPTFEGLSTDFSGYVDWFKVEELGAVQSYGAYKKKQEEKYGLPSWYKEPVPVEYFTIPKILKLVKNPPKRSTT